MSIVTSALLAYFVLLAGVSMVRSAKVESPLVQRLRMFFPSWRFFEDLGTAPILLVRFDGGAWQPALPPLRPPWHAVIFNPKANVQLAAASLVEQLVSELELRADSAAEDGEVAQLASYRLVENLVRESLREAGVWRPGLRYAFKIVYVEQGASWRSGEDAVLSPEMLAPEQTP